MICKEQCLSAGVKAMHNGSLSPGTVSFTTFRTYRILQSDFLVP